MASLAKTSRHFDTQKARRTSLTPSLPINACCHLVASRGRAQDALSCAQVILTGHGAFGLDD
jgi:hypothetical protein